MKRKDLPPDRPLPPNYKFLVTQEFYRVPTWKERLLILLGYRLRITLKMATLHH